MKNSYEEAKQILKKYNQEHIINYINNLDEKAKQELINQVLRINFEELEELYKKTFEDIYVDLEELQPISGVNPEKLKIEEIQNYKEKGINIIKNNKFAVATMAGGQGTRLRSRRTKRNIQNGI